MTTTNSTPPAACDPSNPNAKAFLKLLRWLENHPNDDDRVVYYTMYGGKTFTDTTKHPNLPQTRWGKTSTAAGAYMILYGTWKEAKDKGIVSDFTPASQDTLAWWKIGQRKAAGVVCDGRNSLEKAFKLLQNEWSSVPGASQNSVKLTDAKNRYEYYLLEFTPPAPVSIPKALGG